MTYRVIISLQYHKLHMRDNDFTQELMDTLSTKAVECLYKEYDMLLTEQILNVLNDNELADEILKEVATPEDIEDATSEYVLLLACKG